MILDHFFPACNRYIDDWLIQIKEQKLHYMRQFDKEPLTMIIAGRPYNNNHHNVIIENNIQLDDFDEIWGVKEYIKFFSNKQNRHYIMIDFYYIERLLEAFHMLDRHLYKIYNENKILIDDDIIEDNLL